MITLSQLVGASAHVVSPRGARAPAFFLQAQQEDTHVKAAAALTPKALF